MLLPLFGKVNQKLYEHSDDFKFNEKIEFSGHFNGKDVAVKCIPHELKELINNEFENHLKMKAYENTNIERFGIPDLKYSGTTFDGRIHVFCFTFLESSEEKFNMKSVYRFINIL